MPNIELATSFCWVNFISDILWKWHPANMQGLQPLGHNWDIWRLLKAVGSSLI
jgi:hypothetical protein